MGKWLGVLVAGLWAVPAHADPGQGASAKASGSPVEQLTLLERSGRDIYLREGCAVCHVKPVVGPSTAPAAGADVLAPDLDLIGGKYPDAWHYQHFANPLSTSPGSTMPAYKHLFSTQVPGLGAEAKEQAEAIVVGLANDGLQAAWNDEIIAITAFLQRIGLEERERLEGEARAAEETTEASDAAQEVVDDKDSANLEAGRSIYEASCAVCHRPDLAGGLGPSLVDDAWIHGGELPQIIAVVERGVPAKGMPAWGPVLGDEKVRQVSLYVHAKSTAAQH